MKPLISLLFGIYSLRICSSEGTTFWVAMLVYYYSFVTQHFFFLELRIISLFPFVQVINFLSPKFLMIIFPSTTIFLPQVNNGLLRLLIFFKAVFAYILLWIPSMIMDWELSQLAANLPHSISLAPWSSVEFLVF